MDISSPADTAAPDAALPKLDAPPDKLPLCVRASPVEAGCHEAVWLGCCGCSPDLGRVEGRKGVVNASFRFLRCKSSRVWSALAVLASDRLPGNA